MATIIIENKFDGTISNFSPYSFLQKILCDEVPEIFKVLSVSQNFNDEFMEEFRGCDDDIYYSYDLETFLKGHTYSIYGEQMWDIGCGNASFMARLRYDIETATKLLDYMEGVR